MKSRIFIAAMMTAAVVVPTMVDAQVIIMRKTIDPRLDNAVLPPGLQTPPPGPDGPIRPGGAGYYAWTVTSWAQSGSCGSRGTETRTVQCLRTDGVAVADSKCTGNGSGAKPVGSRPTIITATCGYSWQNSEWSPPGPFCGTVTQTRDSVCMRSDGSAVNATLCGPTPAKSRTLENYEACTFGWGVSAWNLPSDVCGPVTATRTVACQRSDGRTAEPARCTDEKPSATEEQYDSLGCSVTWKTGRWKAQPACGVTMSSRSVACVRGDGTAADETLCPAPRPDGEMETTDYSTCGPDGPDGLGNPSLRFAWSAGAWSPPSTTCGAAVYTRAIRCADGNGVTVADAKCTAQKPDTTETDYLTSGCTTDWATGAYGDLQPACGATTRSRVVYCRRSDDRAVYSSECPSDTRPASSEPGTDYSACSFGWTAGGWSDWSATCGPATRTRNVDCQRSDGTAGEESSCSTASKPEIAQSSYQTAGCGIDWIAGRWSAPEPACGATTQSRTVTCQRSDGQRLEDDQCVNLAKPSGVQDATNYSTCSFAWAVGGWNGQPTTCGTITQTRSVACQRSDGQTMDDTQCAEQGAKPDSSQTLTDVSSCTYQWNAGEWGDATPACGTSTHARTVRCLRSDGSTADASFCTDARPAATGPVNDYKTCSYDWQVSSWKGAAGCGDTVTQTRTVGCLRSNGDTVGDASCTGGGAGPKPAPTQAITDYSSCGYSWKVVNGAWSGGTCSATATRQNTVTCLRSDGQDVDESFCTGARPASQDTGNFAGCSYSSAYSDTYSACAPSSSGSKTGTQIAPITSCTRSDGTTVDNALCSSKTTSRSCTVTYTASAVTYANCQPSAAGSMTGTETGTVTACYASNGSSAPTSACSAPTRSCTIASYKSEYGSYGSCENSKQTAAITSCSIVATDGVTNAVPTSYCPSQTNTISCTGTGNYTCTKGSPYQVYATTNTSMTNTEYSGKSLAAMTTYAQAYRAGYEYVYFAAYPDAKGAVNGYYGNSAPSFNTTTWGGNWYICRPNR